MRPCITASKPILKIGADTVMMKYLYLSASKTTASSHNIRQFKIRRDYKKKIDERRIYDSVTDRSLSYAVSLKPRKKKEFVQQGGGVISYIGIVVFF